MPSRLAERLVAFLDVHEHRERVSLVEGFTERQWMRIVPWLDSSGLALYFLHLVQELNAKCVLPPRILSRLQQNMHDNVQRTASLQQEMHSIGEVLAANAVEFAVLKGYSLMPEYCPSAILRHQCDLDFLITEDGLQCASRGLRGMGYFRLRKFPGTYTFSRQTGVLPARDEIYKAGLNYSVELHTSLWENHEVARLEPLPQVLERRRLQHAFGQIIPILAAEDQFIHQCMHILSHTLQFWIRLAWLYEMAHFLVRRQSDTAFWQAVMTRIGDRKNLAKAVQLVALLAERIFGAPVPSPLAASDSAPALWVREHGKRWALHDMPGSKLSLLLFREFMQPEQWESLERQRLFPLHRLHPATPLNASRPRRTLRTQFAEYRYARHRLAFHVRETWNYLRERRKWRLLLQTQATVLPAPGKGLEAMVR